MTWFRRRHDDLMHLVDPDFGGPACGARRDVATTSERVVVTCPVCRDILGL